MQMTLLEAATSKPPVTEKGTWSDPPIVKASTKTCTQCNKEKSYKFFEGKKRKFKICRTCRGKNVATGRKKAKGVTPKESAPRTPVDNSKAILEFINTLGAVSASEITHIITSDGRKTGATLSKLQGMGLVSVTEIKYHKHTIRRWSTTDLYTKIKTIL